MKEYYFIIGISGWGIGEKRRWAGEGTGYQELLPHQDQILFLTLHHGRSKMNSLQHLVSRN
jgi:hypothetical protein